MPLNDNINESQFSIFSNQKMIKNKKENENEIHQKIKGKLETVREVNSEFSNRRIESKKPSNYNKQLSKNSSNTEKIDSERCIENYDKKTFQLMKSFLKKNNYNTNEYFRANSCYNFIEHKSSFFMKHSENNSEDDFKIKLKKNSWNNLKIIFFEINFNSIIKLWSIEIII